MWLSSSLYKGSDTRVTLVVRLLGRSSDLHTHTTETKVRCLPRLGTQEPRFTSHHHEDYLDTLPKHVSPTQRCQPPKKTKVSTARGSGAPPLCTGTMLDCREAGKAR
jgi:hypothetical protein